MGSRVSHITFNCNDAFALSEWWKQILDFHDVVSDPNEPGDTECMIVDPAGGPSLLFIEVEELQDPDGRTHFDLTPTDRRRDEEIERVLSLGARPVADRRTPNGAGWMVLADPIGNLFCVVRSEQERTTADS